MSPGLAACAGLATLALSHGAAIWAIGGLEQALQSALLAWTLAVVAISRAPDSTEADDIPRPDIPHSDIPLFADVLLALLVLTRPDGALFCVLIALGLLVAHGISAQMLGGVARLVWLPALAWLGHEAFRVWYYNDWVPNTAYAKLSGSPHHLVEGLRYLCGAIVQNAPILALAILGLGIARPLRRRDIMIPLIVAAGWSLYVVFVGGNIFPGRRHFMPVLVSLAFLIVGTWRRLAPSRIGAGFSRASLSLRVRSSRVSRRMTPRTIARGRRRGNGTAAR